MTIELPEPFQHAFGDDDQAGFAELSGDHNPLHVSALAARRTSFGTPLVHGLHALLWALEALAQRMPSPQRVVHLRAQFRRPIRVGTDVRCAWSTGTGPHSYDANLTVGARASVNIRAVFEDATSPGSVPSHGPQAPCVDLSFEAAAVARGTLPLWVDDAALRERFPSLWRVLGNGPLAELLATTRLVGMVCPGLHSIFGELDLRVASRGSSAALEYSTVHSDLRYGLLRMAVAGPSLAGAVLAFRRPPPRGQVSMLELRTLIAPTEFSDVRALVVGGSRGLGEAVAKIVAAGGGEATVTYNRGLEDAERVVREIGAAGGRADLLEFDCTARHVDLPDHPRGAWTHVYYFATPAIVVDDAPYTRDTLNRYLAYYVDGFIATVRAARGRAASALAILYPSTIFLDTSERGALEYCAAKAAGEVAGRYLERELPNTKVFSPRLPRMRTDQTESLLAPVAPDAHPILIEAIRAQRTANDG